ncbi:hypothetical protein Y1Q_0015718 [Alligator mississippiensis]|uniref:Uncharacterized protein n=1 Tax=Alligator mississippiensis TaxID=8496 RepID=A0A151NPB4_ALLMI|nr:hypothetical protein Y1Q_0015718 [Alligator mississippiensis]
MEPEAAPYADSSIRGSREPEVVPYSSNSGRGRKELEAAPDTEDSGRENAESEGDLDTGTSIERTREPDVALYTITGGIIEGTGEAEETFPLEDTGWGQHKGQ